MNYAPLFWAMGFAATVVGARLLTNRILLYSLNRVPSWLSAIYMVGFLGLGVACAWAAISIAWWAGLIVLGLYGLTRLVPSAISGAAKNPKVAHLAAIQQAVQELEHLPAGTEKMNAVMARADEIMRANGWTPNSGG